ncbi:MAG: ATP synthase F0 subunit B [Planctomycetota bacterium]|nr:MAG: ATP synthase F0 subunit B [Planctomycetota bacterium]
MGEIITQMMEVFSKFGVNPSNLAISLVNFVLVLIILQKFAFGPLMEVLEERKKIIADSIKNAAEVETQLKNANEEKRRIIDVANKKAAEIVESAKSAASTVKDGIINEANSEAANIKSKANEASTQERNKMLKDAKAELANLVMGVTENVIGRTLTVDDQTRINEEASKELAA